MHFPRSLAMASIAMLLVFVSTPSISLAHERRTLGAGKYDVVVGWDVEPVYVGERNAASIRISRTGTNPAEPVTGVDKTLKVDIRQGAQTKTFDLRAVFGQPGYYVADIIPTRAGDYILTFTGSIGDDKIDEKFDSADGKFNAVEAATGLDFPIPASDPAQVTAEIQEARSAAGSAQMLGMAGLGAGVLALVAAIGLWLSRRR